MNEYELSYGKAAAPKPLRPLKFVEQLSPLNQVKLSLKFTGSEVELVASNGIVEASVLGVRTNGTIVRYAGNAAALQKLGFQVEADRFNNTTLVVASFN